MTEAIKTADIPVIDITKPGASTRIGEELIDAAATYGFVFINCQGTGFTSEDIDGAFGLASSHYLYSISTP